MIAATLGTKPLFCKQMNVSLYDGQVLLTGFLAAACSAQIGVYLVLRRLAMLADAFSHAVLPGIVLGFLITGTRDQPAMLFGASLAAFACGATIQFLRNKAGLRNDLAIGTSFTFYFALGVILITRYAGQVDLDQDCVLYGELAYAPLDPWRIAGLNVGPRSAWILGGLFVLTFGILRFFESRWIVTSFDPDYAGTIGISTPLWHSAFMALVALTTTLTFESVGAVLIIALFVGPPATALLLSKRLKMVFLLALFIGFVDVAIGYGLALSTSGNLVGAIGIVTGVMYLAVYVLYRQK
jgi:manganese/zinc/iron transport system permease protein